MDFTETTVRGELDAAAVVDAAIDARRADAADLNKSLYALKRRVRDSQRQMAAAFLKLASTIDQIKDHVPATQLRTFLASECGINRADIGTYLKFSETFGEHQEVVTELPYMVTGFSNSEDLRGAPVDGADTFKLKVTNASDTEERVWLIA